MKEDTPVFLATYSNIAVWEMHVVGVDVMRRCHDDWLNATQLLKVARIDKPQRTKILEREIQSGTHEKVQGGYGKYQGTWVPFTTGIAVAEKYKVDGLVRPLLDFSAEKAACTRPQTKVRKLSDKHACLRLLLDGAPGEQVLESMGFETSDDAKRTPLHWAVALGRCDTARLLLGRVMADTVDAAEMTPLMWAVNFPDCTNVFSQLLPLLNARHQDVFGRNVLHHTVLACLLEHVRLPTALRYLKLVLDTDTSFVNESDGYGRSPLELAAQLGLNSLVAMLEDYGGSTANLTVEQQEAYDIYRCARDSREQDLLLSTDASSYPRLSFERIDDLGAVSFAFYVPQTEFPLLLRMPTAEETLAVFLEKPKRKLITPPIIHTPPPVIDHSLAALCARQAEQLRKYRMIVARCCEVPEEDVDGLLDDLYEELV